MFEFQLNREQKPPVFFDKFTIWQGYEHKIAAEFSLARAGLFSMRTPKVGVPKFFGVNFLNNPFITSKYGKRRLLKKIKLSEPRTKINNLTTELGDRNLVCPSLLGAEK